VLGTGGATGTVSSIGSGRRWAALVVAAFALLSALLPAPAAAEDGGPGSAGSSGDAGPTGASSFPVQPPGSVPGIDVSHHQGAIDWTQVAASGQRFAIAKATEGQTFVDPMYATNKIQAETYGIAFGAYHFARPDDQPDDAILEADHFVDTAQLEPGNLIPVLDIERTGGLSQAEITQWILTWLGRVTERLGVRPMVYTSPAGWESRTGDTTAVADAGYTVLWIAHWNVDAPRLPANDWSGNGWAFWQYGDCGTVPGIQGCVDVDWYRSDSFAGVTIPSPDVTPPAVTLAPPVDLTGPVTVSFSEVVHAVTPDNTFVWTPQTGTYPEVALSCRSGAGVSVDCVGGNVRTAVVQPLAPLVPGETYQAVVNPAVVPVAVVDRSGNPAPTTTQDFAAPAEVEETSPAVAYDWRTVANRHVYGRSYAVGDVAGASVSYAFTGRSVTWYTVTGPAQGRAAVRIDGRWVGTFDQYAARPGFKVGRSFTGLERGTHTISVRVVGAGSPDASDALVVVDAFEPAGDVVQNPVLHATWGTVEAVRASGGAVSASDLARSSAQVTFRGTGVVWTTLRGRDQGRAAIYVDGLLVRTVDNYAPERMFGVARTVSGLVDGIHTLRIVVLGEARPAATGALVSIDRFSAIA
jgi:lysozyme